jgi:regulator of nucleoside diphosphate kinase
MREDAVNGRMPSIVVSDADHDRLTSLATAAIARVPEAAEELLAELERAEVVAPMSVPPDVVRMGSTIDIRSDNGQRRRVTLVFPGEADIAAGKVSILTPIGTALIGLAEGQSITWAARDGRRHRLTVLAVEAPAGASAS